MGSDAAGEINFEKLDNLTREQTKDIVSQVEKQFKNLKQTQRDLIDGTLSTVNDGDEETTGMSSEDIELLSKYKFLAEELN